ncbi:hypothetical protein N9Z46_05725 [Akkermansiaceae bacterium]|nr:hypothetical protein [Akkermansiaceae bacterium]MDB4361601.1 hypothetical protein [Akkermansiaceae bacterium]MDB4390497.1 hypothetical protein [Akkermansiaceae bacterium]MDB4514992.1 hypothetical protein [Akkermansiaceae bacterium]MDC0291513.1 hypothetical protein [Akkermansiaceae bacterium]
MMKALLFFLITSLWSFSQTKAPLGLPKTLEDLYVPGSKIEVIPRTNNESSLVIRILEIKPAANGFRYDFEIYALDPGTHRIAEFLRYATDRSPIKDLDATFEVTTTHSLDTLPKPSEPEPVEPEKLGGYKNLIIVLGIFWLLIFLAIIFYRKKHGADLVVEKPLPTLHEKLQVLVSVASQGEINDQQQANLERLILGHWKEQIPEIDSLTPARALVELRSHPEASPLILKLEEWLHAPNTKLSREEFLPLLAPYVEK